jgi:hypothetical protein
MSGKVVSKDYIDPAISVVFLYKANFKPKLVS